MSFKRRVVRRQVSTVAAPDLAMNQPTQASPPLAASGPLGWEVAVPKLTRYTPVNVDRGRVMTRRATGKASGHR